MNDMPTYPWFDQVPEGLKTRKQLAEYGLRPGGPVAARVVWRQGKRWADLYTLTDAKPKRVMSEAQCGALDKAHQALRTCPECGTVHDFVLGSRWIAERDCGVCFQRHRESERRDACTTARAWSHSSRTIILDTETTDLDGYIVQLAIIDTTGTVLFETLVHPEAAISPDAAAIHGLNEERLRDAPTFADIAEPLSAILTGRRIVTYNAEFDSHILWNEIERLTKRQLLAPGVMDEQEAGRLARQAAMNWCDAFRWRCAMELYAQYVGDWNEQYESYAWQPLPGGDHSALGDARACLELLRRMAAEVTR